jgi:hypothetical protein
MKEQTKKFITATNLPNPGKGILPVFIHPSQLLEIIKR